MSKMKTITGNWIDLADTTDNVYAIEDIAWGLGRQLRYNGHIKVDFDVALHSLLASYVVPREYALHALLHDAAEAYTGDIINPLKQLLGPEFTEIEHQLTYDIFETFGVNVTAEGLAAVKAADTECFQWEWRTLGRGKEQDEYDCTKLNALCESMLEKYGDIFATLGDEDGQSYWAFLRRFCELTGRDFVWSDFEPTLYPEMYYNDEQRVRAKYDEIQRRNGEPSLTDEQWEEHLKTAQSILDSGKLTEEAMQGMTIADMDDLIKEELVKLKEDAV